MIRDRPGSLPSLSLATNLPGPPFADLDFDEGRDSKFIPHLLIAPGAITRGENSDASPDPRSFVFIRGKRLLLVFR